MLQSYYNFEDYQLLKHKTINIDFNFENIFKKLQDDVVESINNYSKNLKKNQVYKNKFLNKSNGLNKHFKNNSSYNTKQNDNNFNNFNNNNYNSSKFINNNSNHTSNYNSNHNLGKFNKDIGNNNGWRISSSKLRLNSLLANTDKFELNLNKELNKLSSNNFDIIYNNVISIFIEIIYFKINSTLSDNNLLENFNELKKVNFANLIDNIKKYQNILWSNLINKIIVQKNYCDIYFKFILKLVTIKHDYFINKIIFEILKNKFDDIVNVDKINVNDNDFKKINILNLHNFKKYIIDDKLLYFKTLTNYFIFLNTQKLNFIIINNKKNELIKYIINFLNKEKYFESKETINIFVELIKKEEYLQDSETFLILGKFINFFIDITKKRNNLKNISDTFINALLKNFKLLNDMLVWEPIDLNNLQNRIYFLIGFLNNNYSFIQNLSLNNFNVFNSELSNLSTNENLPSNLKYKVLDCIDNIKQIRNKKK